MYTHTHLDPNLDYIELDGCQWRRSNVLGKKTLLFFPYLIIFYETVLYLSNDMYLPAMLAIENDLNLSQGETQSTLTFWFIGASALQLFLGPLSDRYGRKIIVIISCILFIFASILCAIADSLTLLLIARFIQGTAICSLLALYAAIHELFSTKQAIKLVAIVTSVTVLAPAFGPLIGALLVQFSEWRYIFWLLTALGVISLFTIVFFMPESNTARSEIDVPKVINDYKSILTNKNFILPSLGYFLLIIIEFAWIFESPFIIIEVFNTSPLFYGVAQTVIFSSYLFGALMTKWVLDRYSVTMLIKYSLYLTVFGTFLLLATATLYENIYVVILCMIIISFGCSMLFGPLNRLAIEACSEPMGRRTAIFSNGISLAGVLTGVILGVMDSEGVLAIAVLIFICIILTAIVTYKSYSPNSE